MRPDVLLASNLPQLQNLIKRDPAAYREEFLQQWNHFNSILPILQINPDQQSPHFRQLISFISQVSTCYPIETARFPSQVSSLLRENYTNLSLDTRKTLVQNLVMLRKKNAMNSMDLLGCLLPLLPRTTSSTLRAFISKTILLDIRSANIRTKNHKLNRAVQAMLFGMVERGVDGEVFKDRAYNVRGGDFEARDGGDAMWAVILTMELWKKRIWSDSKSVSIVALGCLHPIVKVQSASIRFFLGGEELEDSDDKEVNFPAVLMLTDPQTFAERLYDNLHHYDKQFTLDHRILIMQLLSRVIGVHKLCVLPFYTYIMKYLTYHQLRVPSILVALAQSVHDLSPPDAIVPIIKKLAHEFVHPGVGSEVITAGLNSIREVCRRQPLAMEEDLLGDLVAYRKSRDKAAMAAARGLLQLYREVNPSMLKRRERGKGASMEKDDGARPLQFGRGPEVVSTIEGLQLLEKYFQGLREEEGACVDGIRGDNAAWEGWDIESESPSENSGDEGWIDVGSDNDQTFDISDSEDERSLESGVGKAVEGNGATNYTSLAVTKILTPADFSLLDDLRVQAAKKENKSHSKAKRKFAASEAHRKVFLPGHAEEGFISENDILGPRKKSKANYEERVASIQKGREGREKFGSHRGKKRQQLPSSSTNRQKARNKPVMMILSSGSVRGKKQASLREKQRKLRQHVEKIQKSRR